MEVIKKIIKFFIIELIFIGISIFALFVNFNMNSDGFIEIKHVLLEENKDILQEKNIGFELLSSTNDLMIEETNLIIVGEDPWFIVPKIEENSRIELSFSEPTVTAGGIKLYFEDENNLYSESYVTVIEVDYGESTIVIDFPDELENVRFDVEIKNYIDDNAEIVSLNYYTYNISYQFIQHNIVYLVVWFIFMNILFWCRSDLLSGKKIFLEIAKYYKENKLIVWVSSIIVSLTFIFEFTHYTLSVDEQIWGFDNITNSLNWIYDGRFTIAIFKSIFMLGNNFPALATPIIAAGLLLISGLIWIHCLDFIFKQQTVMAKVIFVGIYCSFPMVVTEYFCFNTFCLEVSGGLVITAIATYYLYEYFERMDIKNCIRSIVLLVIAMGTYQNFVSVYVLMIGIYFWGNLLGGNSLVADWKRQFKLVVISAISTIIAIAGYYVLYNLLIMFMPSRDALYIDGFLPDESIGMWDSITQSFESIHTLIENNIQIGSVFYLISILVYCICITISMFIIRKWEDKILMFLLTLVIGYAPFFLWIGMRSVYGLPNRSMHGLMVFAGLSWYILIYLIGKISNKDGKYQVCIILAIVVLGYQIQYTNLAFLEDYRRYEEDVMLLDDIVDKAVDMAGTQYITIYAVGTRISNNSNNIILGQVIGQTLWAWDNGVTRVGHLALSEGYQGITILNCDSEILEYYENKLSVWPAENSMCVEYDDEGNARVYVRLS